MLLAAVKVSNALNWLQWLSEELWFGLSWSTWAIEPKEYQGRKKTKKMTLN